MLKKEPTVSAVIPNWNGKKVIGDCVRSLKKQSYKLNEIIVVENGSKDGSAKYISENFPYVTILQQDKNLGFAGGVNVGIKAAKSDYVWLFNNDAEADKDCLKNIIATAVKNKADIVSSVILTGNGKLIDSDGDTYSMYGIPFPRHRNAGIDMVPKKDEPIFSASGGASLYKKSLFDEIGYFDEMFFAYYEDVDLSMRAQLAAKKIWLSHNAIVHHKMNYTSKKVPGLGEEMTIKNSIYIFWKDLPFPLIIKVFPRFLYANWRITAITILHRHPRRAVRGQLLALLHSFHLLKRRIQIQSTRKVTSRQFEELIDKRNPFRVLKELDKNSPKNRK